MPRRNRALETYLLRDPGGPSGQHLRRALLRVENVAKVGCPVDRNRLRPSITHTDPVPVAEGLAGQVGTNVEYSLAVHEGSASEYAPPSWKAAHARGHVIPPRRFLTNALPAARG